MDAKKIQNDIINGVNVNQVVVSLPFPQYVELLRVYREVMVNTSPTLAVEKQDTTEKASSSSTTDDELKTKQTDNDDIYSVSSDTPPPPPPSTTTTPKLASTIEIIEKDSNQSKQLPSPTTKGNKETHSSKAYGKQIDFDCRVQLQRLSVHDIREASSRLGDLPKISFKEYMNKQKYNDQREPIDTTRRKSTTEQIRNNRSTLFESKRKHSPPRTNDRKKDRREMIENLTRNITAALQNDSTIDSLEDSESIKKWLVSKTIHSYEECHQQNHGEKKLR